MNKVILIGRLARDPEVRYTQSSEPMAICRFTVAVDRPFSRNRGENDKTADFLNCVCLGKRGESIGQYFTKGRRIAVTGRIQTGEYTDQQGNKRYTTDIVVDDFEFVENKGDNAGSTSAPSFNPAPQNTSKPDDYYPIVDSTDDDNLPF